MHLVRTRDGVLPKKAEATKLSQVINKFSALLGMESLLVATMKPLDN